MNNKVRPVFIISLPRAGSTLLQRILMGHSKISSIAEPWLLLPFMFANKNGVIAKYSHQATRIGINDLINNLPNKEDDYLKFVADFAKNIYSSLCKPDDIYFLDKTPRYSLIIPEIAKMFPEAKFIFLFRNPVQIFASMLSIKDKNNAKRFKILGWAMFYDDLIKGPELISNGYSLLKAKSYAVQYEQFVNDPEKYTKEILNYLDLEYEPNMISGYHSQDLKGRHGDTIGHKNYRQIEPSVLDKWKEIFNTAYRKSLVLKYVNNLNEEALSNMGYKKSELIDEIKQLNTKGKYPCFRDVIDFNIVRFKNKYNRLSFD